MLVHEEERSESLAHGWQMGDNGDKRCHESLRNQINCKWNDFSCVKREILGDMLETA